MSDQDIDIEPVGDTLDGADRKDSDDASDGAGEAVKARRPAKKQGRRGGKRVRFPVPGEPGYIDVLMP